jgi:hypothetical protein
VQFNYKFVAYSNKASRVNGKFVLSEKQVTDKNGGNDANEVCK